MSRRRGNSEDGEIEETEQTDWEAKFRAMEALILAAESPAKQTLSTSSTTPSRNNTIISTDSTSGQGASNTIVNVNTHTDQRIFQVMTAKRMTARGFEEMIPIVQAGQKLSHIIVIEMPKS